jgi:hypothetical protein
MIPANSSQSAANSPSAGPIWTTPGDSGLIHVLRAQFGYKDVTSAVKEFCEDLHGYCPVLMNGKNLNVGDPWPRYAKRLTVVYTCGDSADLHVAQYGENEIYPADPTIDANGQTVHLTCKDSSKVKPGQFIQVQSAFFGGKDITAKASGHCDGSYQGCNFQTNPQIVSDEIPGYSKRLTILFSCGDFNSSSNSEFYFEQLGQNGLSPSESTNAHGQTAHLRCGEHARWKPDQSIEVMSAFFGGRDITWHVASFCRGAVKQCLYQPDSRKGVGDPIPGLTKKIVISYRCGTGSPKVVEYGLDGLSSGNNADQGTPQTLSCP